MIDKVFDKEIKKQFEFDEEVASVFDDMLNRSVPFYKESLRLSTEFASKYLEKDDIVYDLGSSTGTTLIELSQKFNKNLKLIGIDNSYAMVQKAKQKSHAFGLNIEFLHSDIFDIDFKSAKVFISNYTLQFIRPLQREKLIKKIYDSTCEGGVFIFSEKIISQDKKLNKEWIDEYYNYKKQKGYSDYEISQKREALENVLIPYTKEENIKMIKDAGFKHCESIFQWINFATFIAIK